MTSTVVVAGATGNLGGRIVKALQREGATVWALVRPGSDPDKLGNLVTLGAEVLKAELDNPDELAKALRGADVVVSALNGVRPVIVDGQKALLNASLAAGVRRFIPSDYAADFTKTSGEENRNFELRREFAALLDSAPIGAVSVLNGMFMDLLAYGTPMLEIEKHSVTYWGSPEQAMDFTTMDDTAAVTAKAALMHKPKRYLRVAGDTLTPKGLAEAGGDIIGQPFSLHAAGSLADLGAAIEAVKASNPGDPGEEFPRWQQMQYVRNMSSGRAKLEPIDNDLFPDIRWTTVRDFLAQLIAQNNGGR